MIDIILLVLVVFVGNIVVGVLHGLAEDHCKRIRARLKANGYWGGDLP